MDRKLSSYNFVVVLTFSFLIWSKMDRHANTLCWNDTSHEKCLVAGTYLDLRNRLNDTAKGGMFAFHVHSTEIC